MATALMITIPAAAAVPDKVTVNTVQDPRFWVGVIAKNGPGFGGIAECQAVACDKQRLEVKLPNNVWNKKLGGVEVSIRWTGGFTDILNLYVYKDGARIAASGAGVGLAQSVLLPNAKNGKYEIYVAYTPAAESPKISYEGVSEVEFKPAAKPSRDLLPDLQARPQEHVTFDTPQFDVFEPAPAPGETCFDSEKLELGAETCLRFDQIMANVGEGALDIRFDRETGVFQDEDAVQRIYHSGGGFRDVPVGPVEFHGVHGHYHFEGFAASVLWATDGSGNRTGTDPVASGQKVSFCIADTDLDKWGVKGNGPTTYPAPNCLEPERVEGTTEFFKQGMTAGFADRYTWDLPAQFVEVTGVPNGDYILDTRVDPENLLSESNNTNNCAAVRVRLTNMGTADRHAEIIGVGPACS